MTRTTFVFSNEYAGDKDHMGFGGWVVAHDPFHIYLSRDYFKIPYNERPPFIIHEYIHLLFSGGGHPGGVILNLVGPANMNIPFELAEQNAYCYQYFAQWLSQAR